MITLGILFLLVGVIVWAVARRTPVPTPVVIIGDVLGIVGAVLLLVGIVLFILSPGHVDLTPSR